MAERFSEADLIGAEMVSLLDFNFAGRVWRLATEVADITDGSDTLSYSAGLMEIDFPQAVVGFSTEPTSVSVSLEIYLPDGANVAQLVADGHDLTTATGELSQWIKGTAYNKRVRRLVGRASAPVYGAANEPIQLSLVSMPFEDRSALIPGTAVVTVENWPNSYEDHRGNAYPFVFGVPAATATHLAVSPGWVVNSLSTGTLLVAGHEVAAALVSVKDLAVEGAGWRPLSIAHTTDALGRTVAVVVLPASGDAVLNADGRYVVSWAGSLGGMLTRDRTGAVTTAGDLLELLLDQSTLSIDRGRVVAAIHSLRGFHLAGFYDDLDSTTWDFVRSNVLPILPVDLVNGPDGIYPVVYNWMARPEDVQVDWDAQRYDVSRVRGAGVEYRTTRVGQLANEIRISYAHSVDTGRDTRTCVVHGDPGSGSATDRYLSRACHLSMVRHNNNNNRLQPFVETIQTNVVYQPETAARIALWRAAAKALASRRVVYDGPLTLGWVQAGFIVKLTDSDIAFTDQLCMVVGVRVATSSIQFTLETIEANSA